MSILSVYPASGQTRDIDPMSGYCWPTVYDAEPTLAQYWVTVSCLKPRWMWASVTDGGPTLTQLWFKASWQYRQYACTCSMKYWLGLNAYWPANVLCLLGWTQLPANTRRWTSAGLMLGQRCRRWASRRLGQRRVCWECWQVFRTKTE